MYRLASLFCKPSKSPPAVMDQWTERATILKQEQDEQEKGRWGVEEEGWEALAWAVQVTGNCGGLKRLVGSVEEEGHYELFIVHRSKDDNMWDEHRAQSLFVETLPEAQRTQGIESIT